MPPRTDEDDGGRGQHDAECSGDRARKDQSERAARAGDPAEEALTLGAGSEREQRESDRERGPRERREVVDAEERGLALERSLPLELVHKPGELEQSPDGRGRAPRGDRPEQEGDVPPRAQEERDGGGEDSVLGELRGRDEVGQEPVVLRPRQAVERRRDDHRQERGAGDPDGAAGAKRAPALAGTRPQGGERHGQDGHVRELDPGRGGAEPDVDLRLVANVEEDDRDRDREHERPRPHLGAREGRPSREDA